MTGEGLRRVQTTTDSTLEAAEPPLAASSSAAYRQVPLLALMLGLILISAGCSINSGSAPPPGMTCVRAHDTSDGWTDCDLYLPNKPLPTVTVTETP